MHFSLLIALSLFLSLKTIAADPNALDCVGEVLDARQMLSVTFVAALPAAAAGDYSQYTADGHQQTHLLQERAKAAKTLAVALRHQGSLEKEVALLQKELDSDTKASERRTLERRLGKTQASLTKLSASIETQREVIESDDATSQSLSLARNLLAQQIVSTLNPAYPDDNAQSIGPAILSALAQDDIFVTEVYDEKLPLSLSSLSGALSTAFTNEGGGNVSQAPVVSNVDYQLSNADLRSEGHGSGNNIIFSGKDTISFSIAIYSKNGSVYNFAVNFSTANPNQFEITFTGRTPPPPPPPIPPYTYVTDQTRTNWNTTTTVSRRTTETYTRTTRSSRWQTNFHYYATPHTHRNYETTYFYIYDTGNNRLIWSTDAPSPGGTPVFNGFASIGANGQYVLEPSPYP
jgi:hypothetical protein